MKKLIATAALASVFFLTGCSATKPVSPASVPTPSPVASKPKPAEAVVPAPKISPFITLAKDATLGDYLVGKTGMTLYFFATDELNKSNCADQCAINWPPLEPEGALVADTGIAGTLGVITRDNGVSQVTYNGKPLYYWASDKKPGDVTGQGVNAVWSVAKP